jgi:hypothetical protein
VLDTSHNREELEHEVHTKFAKKLTMSSSSWVNRSKNKICKRSRIRINCPITKCQNSIYGCKSPQESAPGHSMLFYTQLKIQCVTYT